MNFEIFVEHLTKLGILQETSGDSDKISQIFFDIDENDIRGA